MKNIVSVSFGKDSLAMLLLMFEKKMKIDEVVFYDTGMEFKSIYFIRDVIKKHLEQRGIKYTELKPQKPFNYMMFDKPVKKRGTNIIHKHGYGWCGGTCRWGTTEKLKAIEKYCKGNFEYVGIAFDEQERLKKERKGNKVFPLAEWELTEKECLQICYDWGFNWLENGIKLYDILDRVSCWCCRNKNLKELQGIYLNLPNYWVRLKQMEKDIGIQMKPSGSLEDLELRYKETGNFSKRGVK